MELSQYEDEIDALEDEISDHEAENKRLRENRDAWKEKSGNLNVELLIKEAANNRLREALEIIEINCPCSKTKKIAELALRGL